MEALAEAPWTARMNTLEGRIPDDLVRKIYSFCTFGEILVMSSTSKVWNNHCMRDLDACKRHEYTPVDKGTGKAVGLEISRQDWRPSVLAREIVFNIFREFVWFLEN